MAPLVHVPYPTFYLPLAVAVLALLLSLRTSHQRLRLALRWLTLLALSGALLDARISPLHPVVHAEDPTLTELSRLLATSWWAALAWAIVGSIRRAVWHGVDVAHQPQARKLLVQLSAFLVWAAALILVAALVYEHPVTGLIATSGVIAVVLGLALQNTLADLFSGLALNIERPFKAGDWVTLDKDLEGQVVETNWRATRIRNRLGDLVVLPNGVVAKMRIQNHALPTTLHVLLVPVSVPYDVPVASVLHMLKSSALQTKGLATEREPLVVVHQLADSAIVYRLFAFMHDFAAKPFLQSALMERIVHNAAAAGIPLALPRSEIVLKADEVPAVLPGMSSDVVHRAPIFGLLTEGERSALTGTLVRHKFAPRTDIVRQGEPGDSLYLIETGTAVVMQDGHELQRLGPGQQFGDISLLTGAPRAATVTAMTDCVVHELTKSDLGHVLAQRPELFADLERMLSVYQQTIAAPAASGVVAAPAGMIDRIRDFFRDNV